MHTGTVSFSIAPTAQFNSHTGEIEITLGPGGYLRMDKHEALTLGKRLIALAQKETE